MSGGSLNYLCYKEPTDLFYYTDEIERAEDYLLRNGYKDIAQDVRRLLEYIYSARNRIGVLSQNLNPVFHAIEWNLSGDYGDDTLREVLESYRTGQTEEAKK